jgi:DNA-binding response OmpR family regulator
VICLTCGQDASRAPNHVSEENLAAIISGWGVTLEPQEALLLKCLLRASPNVVPYERMIQVLYPNPDREPADAQGVVDQRLWHLVQKFEGSVVKFHHVHGVGRALVAR